MWPGCWEAFGMPAGVCSVPSTGNISTSPLPLPEQHKKRQPWAAAAELFGLMLLKGQTE